MRLRPEELLNHLKQQLLPIYVVSGDEPLLVQEACDLVRRHAREQGCSDREVIDASPKNFDWQEMLGSASSMSLFSERKLIEVLLPSGKPGAAGSKALCAYVEMAGPEDVLLLIAGKIDKQSMSSKWVKTLDKAGAIIQVWPVGPRDLPRWLEQRVSNAGMNIERDALHILCERVEGNLLAAVQEIEKLKLLANGPTITAEAVTEAVSDNARYNLFEMVDSALRGNAAASLRMLHGLRGEGTEAAVVLWALSREVRSLTEIRAACERGKSLQQAIRDQRVWNNRVQLVQSASKRHSSASLGSMLEAAVRADGSIKGFADGNPWDNLESLVLALATGYH